MATYMVEVNNKFLVRYETESRSLLSVEHYFLDNLKGVWGAMAYDTKMMKTDTFVGAMLHDELTTVEQLFERFHEMDESEKKKDELASQLEKLDAEIDLLQRERIALVTKCMSATSDYAMKKQELNAERPR